MFHNSKDAINFAVGGNAYLTLQSETTGRHYTYHITAPGMRTEKGGFKLNLDEKLRFVKLLTAPDEYTYLGMIFDVNEPRVKTTKKSSYNADSVPVKALNYLFDHAGDSMPKGLTVRHEGRCCRCGRQLTVPSSIDAGIGPECAEKI